MFPQYKPKQLTPIQELPSDQINVLIKFFTLKDAIAVSRAIREMRTHIHNASVIWQQFGATDFNDFIKRINKLPREMRPLVINRKYTLQFAEGIISAGRFQEHEVNRFMQLLGPDLSDASLYPRLVDEPSYLYHITSDNGLTALREGLITLEQANRMPKHEHLYYLLSDRGLAALRKGFITPDRAAGMDVDELANFIGSLTKPSCAVL